MIPIRLLLVEDNELDAETMKGLLKRARIVQVTTDTVEWLSAALTVLKNKPYDVILLDLGLKDSQGIDTAAAVIREAPNVPVIVMSGRNDLEVAQRALRVGAQHFIVKSGALSPEELELVILYALERKRYDQQAKEMILETRDRLSGPGGEVHNFQLMEPHLKHIEDAVGQVETYLAKNNPNAYESVRSILDQAGFFVACREIRSILDLEGSRQRGRPLSERAMEALRINSKAVPVESVTEAKQAMADALLRFDEGIWGSE